MNALGFAVFDTALGYCGLAWNARGIVGAQLPDATDGAVRARLRRQHPDAPESEPPPAIQHTIDGVRALLRGELVDLSSVALDLEGVPDFNRSVYEVVRAIPPGATLTYGDVAAKLGAREGARDVGQALGENPIPIVVPCHRVVAAGGKVGGFSAKGGAGTKLKLLAAEGRPVDVALPLFDETWRSERRKMHDR